MNVITGDTLIGELLKLKAAADTVIVKRLGNACFSCPAITTEPLSMACAMHGVDLTTLLEDLNALEDGVTDVVITAPESKSGGLFAKLRKKK
jgi:hypothetical protein